MSQPLSIEHSEWTYLITTRTSGSRLWLIKNKDLEQRILGCLARYQEIYQVQIFGFILMGNHYHLLARFPQMNRALFMRDFNSSVARIIGRAVKSHGRRSVWARRYSYQILTRPEDIRHWLFYVALNPVSSGIVEKLSEYPSYNSFNDAIEGRERTYRWINWSKYLQQRRLKKPCREEDFSKEYVLRFSRLPGEEEKPADCYQQELRRESRERVSRLVEERHKAGRGFLGIRKFLAQEIGCFPRSTKQSTRSSFRPLVLSLCRRTKRAVLRVYFSTLAQFTKASLVFRETLSPSIPFPGGTYPPPRITCC